MPDRKKKKKKKLQTRKILVGLMVSGDTVNHGKDDMVSRQLSL